MSSPSNEDDLTNFCSVTGASMERAKFFVEAANGDLGLAIESFFENGGGEDEASMDGMPAAEVSGTTKLEVGDMDDDSDDQDYNPFEKLAAAKKAASEKASPRKKKPAARKVGNIFSLNDMNGSDEDGDESDEEKSQEKFYAGGSSTSGQQILGPKKKNPESIIKDLFEKAKEHGAQEVDMSDEAAGAATSKKTAPVGTGYRLGTGTEPSQVIPGGAKGRETKTSILKLWKNGFNIDDGQLRSYEDEKNKEFLASIQRGELPRELVNKAQGGEVHLDMQDHREEEFVAPKQAYKLYSTEGQKLGDTAGPTPVVASTLSTDDKATNEDKAKKVLNLDSSKPTTQIRITLSDGSRMIVKLNLTHTLKDLRVYINNARPEYYPRSYTLMTSFPNKELTNNEETIEGSKLQSASIIQKLI